LERAVGAVRAAMEEFAFQRALAAIWEFIGVVNRYVDSTAPWALARDPARRDRLDAVLYTMAESLRWLGILLDPFLPDAAARIRAAVGSGGPTLAGEGGGRLAPGPRIERITALFPRIDTKAPALSAPAPGPAAERPAGAERISLDEFGRVDLRIALVLAAEKVAKSRKLLKLTVKVGEETRTLVAGVAEHYAPEDVIGRKVVIVANLAPATLM